MGKTRSVNRKKKHDDACSKINTIKSGVARPWSDLNHDVLLLVMMKIGAIDFIAFSRVCKSWRSLAVSNKDKFIVSRPPMALFIYPDANKKQLLCYLEDKKGRNFKTILPHYAHRQCIGVTCGYLILMGLDCWLVNLITRHELHFPGVPYDVSSCPGTGFFRAILVFSPPISEWVFVVLHKCSHRIWFCIAGKREWTEVSHPYEMYDLLAFNGKIYTVHSQSLEAVICEMRLYPEPKLVLLETKNIPKPRLAYPGFVSSGENLYVIDMISKHPYKIHELDFAEMKLVSREKTGEEYAFFRECEESPYDEYRFTIREVWADIHSQYRRYDVNDEKGNGLLFHAEMWYFFDDCLNVNLIHE